MFTRSQWLITPRCFDHIWNDECPNDSRRIMPFVAAVPFWFLAGKYALENSSIVCRVPLEIYFLVDILYLWKLGRVVIDFPCVVDYWFRKNLDQIGSHIGIVSWNIQHILCLISSFKQRDVGEILVGFQGRWTSIYYFFDSQIFYEVLDIFPRLSYRLTFIMLNVGMVDNPEFW